MLYAILAVLGGLPLQQDSPDEPNSPREGPGRLERRTPPDASTMSAEVRLLWSRPRVRFDTREYVTGVFSGLVDMQESVGLDAQAPALLADVRLAHWRFSLGGLSLDSEERLSRAVAFEDDTFRTGSKVRALAQVAWFDAYYRIELPEVEGCRFHLLAGIHAPRIKILIDDGLEEANEGFDALWPVPAVGFEARLALTSRIELHGGLVGSIIRYRNPFHLDSGRPPRIDYSFARVDLGLSIRLSGPWRITIGAAYVHQSIVDQSVEDWDGAWVDVGGLTAGLECRF
ncbi:MAG: hypothetical protein HYY16_01415 [Planctomycetes bacterium]|nr:hypothetical protein [Planctomycetota bacterium]